MIGPGQAEPYLAAARCYTCSWELEAFSDTSLRAGILSSDTPSAEGQL